MVRISSPAERWNVGWLLSVCHRVKSLINLVWVRMRRLCHILISSRRVIFKILSFVVAWITFGIGDFRIITIRVFSFNSFIDQHLAQLVWRPLFWMTGHRLGGWHAKAVKITPFRYSFLCNRRFCGLFQVLLMKIFNLLHVGLRFFKQVYFCHGDCFFLLNSCRLLDFAKLFHKKFLFIVKLLKPLHNNVLREFFSCVHLL